MVGDQQGFPVRLHHRTVQQFQALAGPGATYFDTAGQPAQVEGVHRLAEFQHHVVGHVHQRPQAANAGPTQTLLHPQRGFGGGIDPANDPAHVARTVGWIEQRHREDVIQYGRRLGGGQRPKFAAGDRRHFAGDAFHTQTVAAIGRQFDFDDRVVQPQQLAHALPGPAVRRQRQQPVGAFRQPQFFGRTQHAPRLDAAQFGSFDGQPARQHRPDQGGRGAQADGDVRRAADDGQRFRLSHIHGRDPQPVGVGVGNQVDHPADDHLVESRRGRFDTSHFQTGHGQPRRQFRAGHRGIDPFPQPLFADFHAVSLTGTAAGSADRCRRTAADR